MIVDGVKVTCARRPLSNFQRLIKAITKRYREEGINIPFPIRTLDIPEDKKIDLRK